MNTVEPNKSGCRRLLVLIVVGGLLGLAFSKLILGMRPAAASQENLNSSQSLLWFGLFLLFVPLAYWLVIFVHEVGHVIAGHLVKFRFRSFIAGPLRLEHKQGRIRPGWNRSVSAWGGRLHLRRPGRQPAVGSNRLRAASIFCTPPRSKTLSRNDRDLFSSDIRFYGNSAHSTIRFQVRRTPYI